MTNEQEAAAMSVITPEQLSRTESRHAMLRRVDVRCAFIVSITDGDTGQRAWVYGDGYATDNRDDALHFTQADACAHADHLEKVINPLRRQNNMTPRVYAIEAV